MDETKSVNNDGDDDDDLCHYHCRCNEDIALCGTDLTDSIFEDFDDEDSRVCIVCADLVDRACLLCGNI